jgi:hypothetical protein
MKKIKELLNSTALNTCLRMLLGILYTFMFCRMYSAVMGLSVRTDYLRDLILSNVK